MADRDPTHLDPRLQPVVAEIVDKANDALDPDWMVVLETYRAPAAQEQAQAAGLSKAHAGQSPHNCCDADGKPAARAFDYAVFTSHGGYVRDGRDPRYAVVAQIAKEVGLLHGIELEWGGDWQPPAEPDWDHIQLANWKSG